jgi:hypothetical protein
MQEILGEEEWKTFIKDMLVDVKVWPFVLFSKAKGTEQKVEIIIVDKDQIRRFVLSSNTN